MKDIFVHVGVHKTGTTAIQVDLSHNRGIMRDNGILYPYSGCPDIPSICFGHHLIAWEALENKNLGQSNIDLLLKEIEDFDGNIVIISSEEFSRCNDDQAAKFFAKLSKNGYRLNIVFFYKHQIDVLLGLYGTDICYNKVVQPLEEYALNFNVELDYLALKYRWKGIIGHGQVIPVPYLKSEAHKLSATQAFIRAIPFNFPDIEYSQKMQNVSLGRDSALSIQHLWRLGISSDVIYSLIEALKVLPLEKNNFPFWPPSKCIEFQEKFQISNIRFSEEHPESRFLLESKSYPTENEWNEACSGSFRAVSNCLRELSNHLKSSKNL